MVWASKKNPLRHTNDPQRRRILAQYPTCYLHWPGCTQLSTEVDHVIALVFGGTHDDTNLRGICHPCHVRKTAMEAAEVKPRSRRRIERAPGWK